MSTDVAKSIVQVCSALPATDAGWTTYQQLICLEAQPEGVNNDPGEAIIHQMPGYGHLPGDPSIGHWDFAPTGGSFLGKYVRVLLEDAAGPITVGLLTYRQIFVGTFSDQESTPDGSVLVWGGDVVWRCKGIAEVLDHLYIGRGYEISYGAPAVVDPGYCPPFNAVAYGTAGQGDRSSATHTVNGTAGIYVHQRGTPGGVWTARNIVELLLAGFAKPLLPVVGAVGPSWTIDGQVAALAYVPDKISLHGKTVFEALNILISARRGLCWRAVVPSSAPYNTLKIYVDSASPAAYTAGGFTIPAAQEQVTLDTRDDPRVQGLAFHEDIVNCYDGIQVEGAHPLVSITLYVECLTATTHSPFVNGSYLGSLARGWPTNGPEATWDPFVAQGAAYQAMYRRYTIDSSWGGEQLDDTTVGLRSERETTTGASSAGDKDKFGVGGYTGVRSFLVAGLSIVDPVSLKLETFVPVDQRGGIDLRKGLCAPMVFMHYDGGIYEDLSERFDVSIENDPPAVVLNASGADLADLMDQMNTATSRLLVTVGLRESAPLMVSWLSEQASWPRDIPRLLVRSLPWAEQWIQLKGTAYAVTSGGVLTKTTSTQTVLDDLPKLKDYLAILRVWYGQKATTVTWKRNGVIDTDIGAGALRPGALLTTAHRGDMAVTCNAVITGRRYVLTEEGYGTVYTTARILPDIDIVETELQRVRRHRGSLERGNLDLGEWDPDRDMKALPMSKPIFVDRE
jgi:hypothetical protein